MGTDTLLVGKFFDEPAGSRKRRDNSQATCPSFGHFSVINFLGHHKTLINSVQVRRLE
jgi:hypothetical protein